MSDIFIKEESAPLIAQVKEKKPRKARKPLTEEQKDVLRARLQKARDAKKSKKAATPAEVEESAPAPSPPVIEKKKAKKFNIPKRVKPDNTQELEDLKLELQLLKEAKNKKEVSDLREQVLKLKQKPPKQLEEDPVPAPTPAPSPVKKERNTMPVVPEFKKENYSTYKKSIWRKLAAA